MTTSPPHHFGPGALLPETLPGPGNHSWLTRSPPTAFRHRSPHREAEERAPPASTPAGSTARERINDPVDSTPEIGRYSGSGAGDKPAPSGVVTGFRQIDGQAVTPTPRLLRFSARPRAPSRWLRSPRFPG